MAAKGSYQLDIEPPKRNVFVTQLHERDDEDDHTIAAYPVVKENASKLLETGLNTLQKTLLLKKEVEVEHVNDELFGKREEFRSRMDNCAQRQVDIQKKQQKMRDRVTKFEKFIKENEAKRRRAIQKFQAEVKLKEQKNEEYAELLAQLNEIKQRHEYLKRKLDRYKRYEEYLLKVLDILPAHYLEVTDSMLQSLMMRHRTLDDTNETLVANLGTKSDNLEITKLELEQLKAEHDRMKLSINSELSIRQKEQERKLDKNQEYEQKHAFDKVELRHQRATFGQILMAIDNIAEKCHRHMDPDLETMNLGDKLYTIKEYIVERADVSKLVTKAMKDGSSSPTSERKLSPKRGRTSRAKTDTS